MRVGQRLRTDAAAVHEDASSSAAVVRSADIHVLGVPFVSHRGRVLRVLSSSGIV